MFPQIRQIWLASNYAKKEGFDTESGIGHIPQVVDVNNGEVVSKRKVVFLNEWNGEYWEKKLLREGDTVVIENPCFDTYNGDTTTNVCWLDADDVEHCVEVYIPDVAQHNIEYRVFTIDGCDQDLVNTDYLAIERLLRIIVPMIEKERYERIESDQIINERIDVLEVKVDQEIADRIAADEELENALSAETEARIEGDNILSGAIETEREERQQADLDLWNALNSEISRAISAETSLSAAIDTEKEERQFEDERLWEALSAETEAREDADIILDEKIDNETSRATSVEAELREDLDDEIARAKDREDEIDGQLIDTTKNPYTMSATVGKDLFNLVLETKDGNDEHFVKIKFNGDFGEF